MHNLAVHWHEGLFLRPQHLQAWDRHWHEVTTASERWQSPYSYGLAQIAINQDALAAGFFQLDALRAKMLDGTLVELRPGEGAQRIDLRPALERLDSDDHATLPLRGGPGIDVHLAVPRLQLGDCNVAESQSERVPRFAPLQQQVPDDADGNSVEPVLFRRLNAKLLLSTDDISGYETLKLARVMAQTRGGGVATLDARYVPPLLDCAAWPILRQFLLRPIQDLVTTKASFLAQLMKDHSLDVGRGQIADLQQMMVLQSLNQASAVLSVMTQARGVHPLQAYQELARLAGALDVLGPDHGPLPVAPYDHEAIGPLFASMRARIEQRLRNAGNVAYQQKFFIGATFGGDKAANRGLRITLPVEWLQPTTRCLLGIYRGDLPADEVDQLFVPGKLDWKLGSANQVESLFSQRISGVGLTPARGLPKFLPSRSEWSYFEFDQHCNAWSDVIASQTMAMRFRESLLEHSDQLVGNKTLHLRAGQRVMPLQFAVFCFPRGDQ
ncbi:type VI secretion system baseplate subunit TssK [Planctomycetaceae bacterium SH139]